MSNIDIMLEYLEQNGPGGYCDDCISEQLGIEPRQQVNQVARRLSKQGLISRGTGVCSVCDRNKTVNKTNIAGTSELDAARVRDAAAVYEMKGSLGPIDIEKVRTQVVHMCHSVWRGERPGEEPPRSVSGLINDLKESNLLPRHQANMMLTLCNLRNVYVYEELELGQSEVDVARGAWAIVSQWWEETRKQ
jgi:hypothetical protein